MISECMEHHFWSLWTESKHVVRNTLRKWDDCGYGVTSDFISFSWNSLLLIMTPSTYNRIRYGIEWNVKSQIKICGFKYKTFNENNSKEINRKLWGKTSFNPFISIFFCDSFTTCSLPFDAISVQVSERETTRQNHVVRISFYLPQSPKSISNYPDIFPYFTFYLNKW